ncbi:NPCBM/NEW2 domain-containing protein [Clostridium celatum]|uniref:Probable pectate lyase C n=1 Tax=Clostridium celatum DSM 1785 TaxID=545697 RepID=L1QHF4_9CLOT|nr:NPCBM/NEW2 domain-containing protein [Clostridium celatum]EKY27022.1 putative ATP synthase F1, epsilon subunit [Clostridium celatum DSM 1785]MCE9654719.1 NPCBM/NEW2 domain-containing protein [Clostridium celatum]
MRKIKNNVMKKTALLTSIFMAFSLILNSNKASAGIFKKENSIIIDVTDFGADPSGKKDSTEAIYEAIESAKEYNNEVIINFPKGEYQIYKDNAQKREYHTSNTNSMENPIKTIGILIEEQEDLTLEGNGSLFNMHGNMMAIAVVKSENVKLKNFSWDFEVPTTSEMTVLDIGVEDDKNYIDYYIPSNFRYQIVDNNTNILWTSEESPYTGKYYWTQKGHHSNSYAVVIYDPEIEVSRRYQLSSSPFNGVNTITQLNENTVRIIYNNAIPYGQKIGVVNEMCTSAMRETAGAFIWESKDTVLENINIHYMHGFGFLTQMSENVTFDTVNFMPREGTGKYTTSFADLIHVSGAAGKITIKNCNFSHAHDDPINIHGTFTRVEEKIDSKTLKLKYIHSQQGGFPQYYVGNEVAFFTRDTLMSPDNEEKMYTVKEVIQAGEEGNDLRTMIVTFNEELPSDIDEKIGDQPKYVAENATYTPELEIVDNIFHTIPTRGILSTTRKSVLIEGNEFRNMGMATIYLSNDSANWYESGPIRDLTIRNNKFYIRESGQIEWRFKSAIYINPVTLGGALPSAESPIHKNITIEDNEFYMEHDAVVNAESVENLTIRNNKVFRDNPNVQLNLSLDNTTLNENEKANLTLESTGTQISGNEENVFYFRGCKNVILEGNTYDDGLIKNAVVTNMPLDYITNSDDITLNGSTTPSMPVNNIKYVSLNPAVATVSASGEITAISSGEAEVLAYYVWNNTSIESNKVTVTVVGESLEKADSIEITNKDNSIIEKLSEGIKFNAEVLPENLSNQIKWSVTNIDGTSTTKATIDESGLLTAKENGVIIVKASINGLEASKTVVISDEATSYIPSYVNIVNENSQNLTISENGESAIIKMERGDLYNSDNNIRNLVLIDVPDSVSADDMRFTVKVDNLPLAESNRWDTASVLLFKDVDNYISLGKKSHYNGLVTVREVNASAIENDKSGSVNESTLIFDVYNKDGNVTISYKTPDGEYIEWGNLDSSFLGEDYKIGFAVWNHDGRDKDVTFSNLKIATGSEYNKQEIEAIDSIKLKSTKNNKPTISDVTIENTSVKIGEELEVSYKYYDEDNHNEEGSIYKWETTSATGKTVEYTSSKTYIAKISGSITCTVYPRDQYNRLGDPVVSNSVEVSENKVNGTLESIKINSIELSGFESEKYEYDYYLTNSQNNLILSGASNNDSDNIKVTLNGEVIFDDIDKFSKEITLNNSGVITIEVDPVGLFKSKKVYTINVNKLVDNYAKLDTISIEEMDINISDNINSYYHYNVNSDIKDITLRLSANERVGSIKVYETEYRREVINNSLDNNKFENNVTLASGNNLIFIEVTAKDGVTTSKYIINVARMPSRDATLSDIKINGDSIDGFEKSKLEYTIKLTEEESKNITVEATANSYYSTISITNNNERVEANKKDVELKPGLNEVVIACKADDLWTTNYYTLKILVSSDSNATLLSLETPNNNLDPIFESNKTEYSITTSKQDFELVAVAQEENATLEISINGNKLKATNKIEINEKLVAGENLVSIKVISPDKLQEKIYNINITANEFVYLSDLNWNPESYVGYGTFNRDKAPNGGVITLLKDGDVKSFEKGIGAHAQSELIFDIEGKGYERLQGFAGVDYSQATSLNGQVTFKVLLDGVEAFNSGEINGSSECKELDLELNGVKEVRLIALSGLNNWNDHAVWADAKFLTTFDEVIPPVKDADYNDDGVIDIKDLGMASKNYGKDIPQYDINNDNIIDKYEIQFIMDKILEK